MDHTSDLNVSIIIIKLLGVSLIEENIYDRRKYLSLLVRQRILGAPKAI